MFSVIFEVQPRADRWDDYFGYAKLLRPELEKIDGFIDNTRYRSARRPGRLLSLSTWRDEKAVIRWRTHATHVEVQGKGRREVFDQYHLRVGQITADTHLPHGCALREQRLDETETGAAKAVSLVEANRPVGLAEAAPVEEVAARLGWRAEAAGLVDWDLFDAVLTPGDLLLLTSWHDPAAAEAAPPPLSLEVRSRRVRIVRDYGMLDRREAPQYHPPISR